MNLLNQFAEFLEKQDMLSKLTEHEKLHSYGYSEIHVIAAIGDLEEPNVTALAKTLRLTKGAVSKITKRLISSNVIEAYTIPDNRQKIFYRLLEKGRFLYEEHEKRHKLWLERDRQFLSQFTELQLEEFSKFMSSYNGYLEEQIRQLGGREDAD
ncbi:hypothetical protein PMF13cell1_05119 [Blautia producta]|uniref:HTH marR-type domain-containing protein n=1 Tax=Blautia producta TaxID=33035 RepID=A0A4P6M4V0_9FIRM|nr:MarR family transcriptional regulator [Blautia producta]QBE99542.1 hypothetical protein PMF13cell1_05119 [Blautia producta]